MKPNRATPTRRQTAPETTAMVPANATARWGSPAESGNTTGRIKGASAESGPRTRMRDGPNMAYASNGTIVAYRPLIPGTPEASAYAMPTGTSMVVITRPASRSCRSQDDLYPAKTANPGSHLLQGASVVSTRLCCVTRKDGGSLMVYLKQKQ